MRFYLDEDLSPQIAVIAGGRGLDVVSSHELGNERVADEDQLTCATLDNRCLVTGNRDDFIGLTILFLEAQRPHGGVLIIPGTWSRDDFTRIARALEEYARRHTGGSTSYLLDYLG